MYFCEKAAAAVILCVFYILLMQAILHNYNMTTIKCKRGVRCLYNVRCYDADVRMKIQVKNIETFSKEIFLWHITEFCLDVRNDIYVMHIFLSCIKIYYARL